MLKRISVSYRLMLFMPLLLATLIAIVGFGLSELNKRLIDDRKESLKHIVQVGTAIVDGWYQKEKSGELGREEAQRGARDELWRLRYGDNTYFFIQRFDGVTMMHPQRQLEGKNRIDTVDSDGVPTVRRQIEAAQRGGDYVYYRQNRAGGDGVNNATMKLSYVAPFEPWQWAVGTGIYIDDVDAIYRQSALLYLALGCLVLAAGGGVAYVIGRSISHPLSVLTERMSRLADGDLAIDVPFLGHAHEVGRLARALDVFKVNRLRADELAAAQQAEQAAKLRRQETLETVIAQFQERTTHVIDAVAKAAEQVRSNAGNLTEMADQSRSRVTVVNHAANDTTLNVQTVASAAEELSAAVGEVSRQVTRSTDVAERAVAEADRTNVTMRGLADAAQRIGAIVQVIQDIASQTNLLALNATIEAARAGDAGKGFAVVASEVKTLANQTTKATEEIQSQVAGIQGETARAVEAISHIGETVTDMRAIATGIASAMEEQGATTQEIARNIGEAADRTKDVSSNIAGVAEASEVTSRAASELQAASEELRHQATLLNGDVTAFFAQMRAA
jgi:methyl-accepting chemotaxis protein